MKKAVSVSQLNMYIKMLLGNDEHLSDILVKGEISNFKLHHSGHMYFTLKDNKAAVKCVMFASYAGRLDFRPSDGMQITAAGYVSVYEKSGQYQLYVANMMEEGEGALYIKFEKLKKQLMEEGIFDESRKKPLPVLPDTIGVVTSATGSVIKDIINVLDRRYPKYKMLLYPSHVQGKGAEIEIASGIRYFNEIRPVDVIIIARGGGSIEDLWPFNEEHLARTIYASVVPVISAVGHETDFTIADFAADRRAPTPSAAAEIAVPELSAIISTLESAKSRLRSGINNILNKNEADLKALMSRPVLTRPDEIFNIASQSVDRSAEKLHKAYLGVVDKYSADFRELTAKMELLSPLGTITRGYSVLTDADEHVITSIKNASVGQEIKARIVDGTIFSKVVKTEDIHGK
ncbi:MAG: exodeoxyribonuclease VII large subunit [Clostridiales bacterium]|nr:exodeoxyribonuclease VII large subunit [Clostridiales bacterium]